ncbi:N-acetylneuraminate synthase [Azospirillum thermophilum]|uniref:N-acetylneuraminate synthase n=1 Tax=Azospirillum thermophilum TaxID=2202148 RepID=A0A2S2D0N6_9PROT|nr:N-acetylneuraminate synthase [Azospirillum thermophilum]AWK90255.1 N-acetylneuraminate synthase [Azospirillum thermophilum]
MSAAPALRFPRTFTIAGRPIGAGHPCLLIAEAGVNHNGSAELAHRLIDAAAEAGADAVKFQTFRTDGLLTSDAPKAAYQVANTGTGGSQQSMLRALELQPDVFAGLSEHCARRGLLFLSTPFDHESVDLLSALGMPAFKVPSGEVTHPALLEHVAAQGRPVLLSTGMATLAEVDEAVRCLSGAGCRELALLQCTSTYPAPPEEANLRVIGTYAQAFGVPVGFSDHTLGEAVAPAAVALGAVMVEKHFTLDTALPGPDHRASLDPSGFRRLVAAVRAVEAALGDGIKRPTAGEMDTRAVARRSLFVRHALPAGHRLTAVDLVALRPAGGIAPNHRDLILGRRTTRPLTGGERLDWSDLA